MPVTIPPGTETVLLHNRVAGPRPFPGLESAPEFRLHPTTPEESTEIAREAAIAGVQRIIVAGGDGTLRDVARGIVGTQTAVAILPAGTANDYAASAGIPKEAGQAWELARNGVATRVDVAKVNGDLISINMGGIGFDAEVVRRYHQGAAWQRKLPARLRYHLSIFGTFAKFKGVRARLDLDGEVIEIDRLMLLAFGSARQYGDGMVIAPDARLSDGLLNAVWATELSAGELAGLLPKLTAAGHVGHPKVTMRTFHSLRIETDPPAAFHIEGDLQGHAPIEIKVLPAALNVVAGSNAVL
ncbi:MAG: diacylglycerol kinase family lipid kinase [Fimbriimonadaceae bacterium]|nr:diacylglycerol kinase family lipid kinase [Fimbriimonadaceae bacterium]MBX3334582.1 diacylglycerol kinase family lipid kinase [Nitrospira sp.]